MNRFERGSTGAGEGFSENEGGVWDRATGTPMKMLVDRLASPGGVGVLHCHTRRT